MAGYHKHCPKCGEPLARLYDAIACPNGDFEMPVAPMAPEVEMDPEDFKDGFSADFESGGMDDRQLMEMGDDGDYMDRRYTGAVR